MARCEATHPDDSTIQCDQIAGHRPFKANGHGQDPAARLWDHGLHSANAFWNETCDATTDGPDGTTIRCDHPPFHEPVVDPAYSQSRWDHGNRLALTYWGKVDAPNIKSVFEPVVISPVDRAEELRVWWAETAIAEIKPMADKAAVYGSNSLAAMGRVLARAQGREVDDEEALELGCLLYAYGKVERWMDAALRGDRPKDDTIADIGVYAKMALRIRQTGTWP